MRFASLVLATLWIGPLLSPLAQAEDRRYDKPRIDDVRLDFCWSWKIKDCGKRVADTFCGRRHFNTSKDFGSENAGGQTRFIGSGESCRDRGCLGFSHITCTGKVDTTTGCDGASRSVQICHDANPTWKGHRLDRCREWGVNCGEPVAIAYCKAKGFRTYAYFRTDASPSGPSTRLIGTNQICDKPFCRGFQVIRCQR